jgi:hypothetical protein
MPLELIEHLLDHTNACKNCNHAHIFVAGTTLLEGTCNVLFSAVDSVFSVGVVIQNHALQSVENPELESGGGY